MNSHTSWIKYILKTLKLNQLFRGSQAAILTIKTQIESRQWVEKHSESRLWHVQCTVYTLVDFYSNLFYSVVLALYYLAGLLYLGKVIFV